MSTKSSKESGLSLVEVLIAFALLAVIATAFGRFFSAESRARESLSSENFYRAILGPAVTEVNRAVMGVINAGMSVNPVTPLDLATVRATTLPNTLSLDGISLQKLAGPATPLTGIPSCPAPGDCSVYNAALARCSAAYPTTWNSFYVCYRVNPASTGLRGVDRTTPIVLELTVTLVDFASMTPINGLEVLRANRAAGIVTAGTLHWGRQPAFHRRSWIRYENREREL